MTTEKEEVFSPEPKSLVFTALGCGFLLLLAVASLILPWTMETIPIHQKLVLPLAGAPIFSFFAYLLYAVYRSAKFEIVCDEKYLRKRTPSDEHAVLWDEIKSVKIFQRWGGAGGLAVDLRDGREERLLCIHAEPLPEGGRGFMTELQKRLAPIFEKEARTYLEGNAHWSCPFVKDVFRFDDQVLCVEFPKWKKHAIPLQTLRRVEWIPKALGKLSNGVVIEHDGGEIKISQEISGLHSFLFALRHVYGLGHLFPDGYLAPDKAKEVKKLQSTLRQSPTLMIVGSVLIGMTLFHTARDIKDESRFKDARVRGQPISARVTQKLEKPTIEFVYCLPDGQEFTTTSRVTDAFHRSVEEGSTFEAWALPGSPDVCAFDGRRRLSDRTMSVLTLFRLCSVVVGFFCLFSFFVRSRRAHAKIRALQKRPEPVSEPPPLNSASPAAEQAASAPPPFPEHGTSCHHCHSPLAEEYYLSDGAPWCYACQHDASRQKETVRWGSVFRALLTGSIGVVVGAGLWALATILTGFELGFVAVFVGIVVGYAVKLGAQKQGGRKLQVMATILTVLALSYATIPIIVQQVRANPEMAAEMQAAWDEAMGNTPEAEAEVNCHVDSEHLQHEADIHEADTVEPDCAEAPRAMASPEAEDGAKEDPEINVLTALLFLCGALLLLLLGPVAVYVAYLVASPVSILFAAIAIGSAWRLNRREKKVFAGPFHGQPPDLSKPDLART